MANKGGLEGVVVADITTSYIDGEIGKLIYSGYTIEDLAEHATFEEVIFLLHNVRLPDEAELEEVRSYIAKNAAIPEPVLEAMKNTPKDTPAMAVVRSATSMLSSYDEDAENLTDKEVAKKKALRMIGQVTSVCAAWIRLSKGEDVCPPRQDLTLAQNFVYMMTGEEPDETAANAVNVYLVLLAEHGMNASTFTSRVITATGSDMHSAVVGAIGALKGPSHGGANAEAMRMFLEIGEPDNVENWFQTNIKNGDRRIMGMGHRVYKAPDPRGSILKMHAEQLAASSGNSKWFEIASKLEDTALADEYFSSRKLFPNVDYYSAIVLYTLHLDIDMFTPMFVISRMAGWTAHIVDQIGGRLIRPKGTYVGPQDLTWEPAAVR